MGGYLLKRSAAEELSRAIHAVVAAAGCIWIRRSPGKLVGRPAAAAHLQPAELGELSDRETDVVRMVAGGHSNKAIS